MKPLVTISGLGDGACCPAKPAMTLGDPNTVSAPSARGTAYHAARANVDDGKDADPEGEAIVRGVDPADMKALLDKSTPRPADSRTEADVEFVVYEDGFPKHIVPGHIDSLTHYEQEQTPKRWARVLDDKTTHHPENETSVQYDLRMLAYGVATYERHNLEAVQIQKYYPENDTFDSFWITQENVGRIRGWIERVVVEIYRQAELPPEKRTYRPEATYTACLGCSATARCPAFLLEMQSAVAFVDGSNLKVPIESAKDALQLFKSRAWINAAGRKSPDIGKLLAAFIETNGTVAVEEEHKELRLNSKGQPAILKKETT